MRAAKAQAMFVPSDERELRTAIAQISAAIRTQHDIIQQRLILNLPTLEARLECRELELTLSLYMHQYYALIGADPHGDNADDATGTKA